MRIASAVRTYSELLTLGQVLSLWTLTRRRVFFFVFSPCRAGTLCEALLFGARDKKLLAFGRNLISSMKVGRAGVPRSYGVRGEMKKEKDF